MTEQSGKYLWVGVFALLFLDMAGTGLACWAMMRYKPDAAPATSAPAPTAATGPIGDALANTLAQMFVPRVQAFFSEQLALGGMVVVIFGADGSVNVGASSRQIGPTALEDLIQRARARLDSTHLDPNSVQQTTLGPPAEVGTAL